MAVRDPINSLESTYAFDINVKVDHVTNNIIKSFNSQIDQHKGKPLLTLLEVLRRKIMKRLPRRKDKVISQTSLVSPKVQS